MIEYEKELVYNSLGRPYWIYKHDTFFQQRIAGAGPYQQKNLKYIRTLVPDARTIIDVGMNIGMNTIEYATWADEVKSFEPVKQTYDMAQLNSNDPIERESTRVSLVVGIAAAHTMDLNKWKEMLNIDQDYMDKLVSQYIGKLDRKKWMDKTLQNEYISKIDFFDEMDKNDPPFFIVNYGGNRKPKNIADFHHHPMHAKILKNRGDSLKIKNVVYATGIGIIDKSSQGLNAFIIENLK